MGVNKRNEERFSNKRNEQRINRQDSVRPHGNRSLVLVLVLLAVIIIGVLLVIFSKNLFAPKEPSEHAGAGATLTCYCSTCTECTSQLNNANCGIVQLRQDIVFGSSSEIAIGNPNIGTNPGTITVPSEPGTEQSNITPSFIITIISPTNTTYRTKETWFNVTTSIAASSCLYSLDGRANITMSGAETSGSGTSFDKINNSMTLGQHRVVVYCNKYSDNSITASTIANTNTLTSWNKSEIVYFKIATEGSPINDGMSGSAVTETIGGTTQTQTNTGTVNSNITSSPYCINNPSGFNNKVFDCAKHKITGWSALNQAAIYLSSKSGITIKNCIITNNYYGIVLQNPTNNVLRNNNVTNSLRTGVYIVETRTSNSIINNELNLNWICNNGRGNDGVNQPFDIYISSASAGYTGTNNTCDETYNWNDKESKGCTNPCSGRSIVPPTPFLVTLIFPQNITYISNQMWFNVTTSKTASSCVYSLDERANITMSIYGTANSNGGTSFYGFNNSMTEGQHRVIAYCSDASSPLTVVSVNKSELVYFTMVEQQGPGNNPFLVSLTSPTNTTYDPSPMWFNVTTSSMASSCVYSLDGRANATMSGTGTSFYKLNSSMTFGHHNTVVYCSDALGASINKSALVYFTISAVTTPCVETDDGEDYSEFGNCSDSTGLYEDVCDGNNLTEYFCATNLNNDPQNPELCTSVLKECSGYCDEGECRLYDNGGGNHYCPENWACSDWGACISGQQSRTCTDLEECGTTYDMPRLTQNCTVEMPPQLPPCTEDDWQCSDWSVCSDAQQTRTCEKINQCDSLIGVSKESTQECINEEQPSSGLPLWLIIVIAAIILVAIIVILILVLGKKKNNIDSHYTEFTEVSGTSQNPAQTQ